MKSGENKVMSDAEIYKLAREDWLNILRQLWEATGKPVNPAQLKVYAKQLGMIPLGALEAVIGEILKDHQYNNVPTIGEIWSALRTRFGCDPAELAETYDPKPNLIYRFDGA